MAREIQPWSHGTLVLRDVYGLSRAEITSALSEQRVFPWLYMGRKHLGRLLGEQGE